MVIRKSMMLLIILLVVVIVGCTASPSTSSNTTPTVQAAATDTPPPSSTSLPTETPLPTETAFPTITPTPRPTSIPERLEEIPEQFDADDVVVVGGTIAYQILDIYKRDSISDASPEDGMAYFVFDSLLFNYSQSDEDVFRTDFQLQLPNGEVVYPSVDLMVDLQNTQYPNRDFPGRSAIPFNTYTIPFKSWERTFLVYELPTDANEFTLQFGPNNLEPRATLRMWLATDDDETFTVLKAATNGDPNFSLDFETISTQTEVEKIVDQEVIELDNCFGTETLRRTVSLEHEMKVDFSIGERGYQTTDQATELTTRASTLFFLSNPAIRAVVVEGIISRFDLREDEVLRVVREEQFSAEAGTKPRYRMTWYTAQVSGTVALNLSGRNVYIPYTLNNRLRGDLESLEPATCTEATDDE